MRRLLLASVMCACGQPATQFIAQTSTDAGSGGVAIAPPAKPISPEPAVLLPCPAGWHELTTPGRPTTCEPWPSTLVETCAVDEAHFPGEPACRRVGTECTTDDWASGLPSSDVLFVKAGVASGGSGTRAAPFGTVAAAMSAAHSGTVIALSTGTFSEAISLKAGVTLWGACVAQTQLTASAAAPRSGVVTTAGLNGVLKNLRIGAPRVGILVNPSGNSLELDDVIIDGATGVGLLVGNTASVTGHDVVIRNTAASASGTGGLGLDAELGGHISLTRAVLERNHEDAINAAQAGSSVTLVDAVVSSTGARSDGKSGSGATIHEGASLSLTRVVFERNREAAIVINDSMLTATDVLVRKTDVSVNDGKSGFGLLLDTASRSELTRCTFSDNHDIGIQVRNGGSATLHHVVVLDTLPTTPVADGAAAFEISDDGVATLDHVFVDRATAGILVLGAHATLRDVDVHHAVSAGPSTLPGGFQVSGDAGVTLERMRVSDFDEIGMLIAEGAAVSGSDVQLVNDGTPTSPFGAGLAMQNAAAVSLARVNIEGATIDAVQIQGATRPISLSDLSLHHTVSDSTGRFGNGIHVLGPVSLDVNRAEISGAFGVGLFAGRGAVVHATDLRVSSTKKEPCIARGTCEDIGGSSLVVLDPGSSLTVRSFALDVSEQCGVLLATSATVDLSFGSVSGHVIGACVQTAGFDVNRLTNTVDYSGNQQKLDATTLPLPTVVPPKIPTR